jgi:hypothetical protein
VGLPVSFSLMPVIRPAGISALFKGRAPRIQLGFP